MDPQHQFEIEGLVAALSLIVVRLDDPFPLAPRYDAIDLLEKFFLVGCRLSQFVRLTVMTNNQANSSTVSKGRFPRFR